MKCGGASVQIITGDLGILIVDLADSHSLKDHREAIQAFVICVPFRRGRYIVPDVFRYVSNVQRELHFWNISHQSLTFCREQKSYVSKLHQLSCICLHSSNGECQMFSLNFWLLTWICFVLLQAISCKEKKTKETNHNLMAPPVFPHNSALMANLQTQGVNIT